MNKFQLIDYHQYIKKRKGINSLSDLYFLMYNFLNNSFKIELLFVSHILNMACERVKFNFET
jgi:hypothetical protein